MLRNKKLQELEMEVEALKQECNELRKILAAIERRLYEEMERKHGSKNYWA